MAPTERAGGLPEPPKGPPRGLHSFKKADRKLTERVHKADAISVSFMSAFCSQGDRPWDVLGAPGRPQEDTGEQPRTTLSHLLGDPLYGDSKGTLVGFPA